MKIPNPPEEFRDMHVNVWNFFNLLTKQMQQNLSDEGFVTPSQPTANINQLTNSKNGTILYDSTANALKVNVNGVFKTIAFV